MEKWIALHNINILSINEKLAGSQSKFTLDWWEGIIPEMIIFLFFNTLLTHSHTMTPFDAPGKQAFLKTLWEKEKLFVTSNFSFSHSVFYPLG